MKKELGRANLLASVAQICVNYACNGWLIFTENKNVQK